MPLWLRGFYVLVVCAAPYGTYRGVLVFCSSSSGQRVTGWTMRVSNPSKRLIIKVCICESKLFCSSMITRGPPLYVIKHVLPIHDLLVEWFAYTNFARVHSCVNKILKIQITCSNPSLRIDQILSIVLEWLVLTLVTISDICAKRDLSVIYHTLYHSKLPELYLAVEISSRVFFIQRF